MAQANQLENDYKMPDTWVLGIMNYGRELTRPASVARTEHIMLTVQVLRKLQKIMEIPTLHEKWETLVDGEEITEGLVWKGTEDPALELFSGAAFGLRQLEIATGSDIDVIGASNSLHWRVRGFLASKRIAPPINRLAY